MGSTVRRRHQPITSPNIRPMSNPLASPDQSPKSLSKYYKKFGPSIVQRVYSNRMQAFGPPVNSVRSRRVAEMQEYKRIEKQVKKHHIRQSIDSVLKE